MSLPVYYVGSVAEVEHHAAPLAGEFDLRIEPVEEVLRHARPGDMCLFFNEFYPAYREACLALKARNCPTLYAIDGMLEWRNSWELPEDGTCCLWVMRPVLCHKAACIGRSQARVLESWGNLGTCEVVGVPRFDRLADQRPRTREPGQSLRVLVLTAKCPGFTPEQVAVTLRSLSDLQRWFREHPVHQGRPIEVVWRITQGLEHALGVENQLADTTGRDLAAVLKTVDAVIATPSTAVLEGMLQGLPVALLDYHNRPHYVPAAWRITAECHIEEVLRDLMSLPAAGMLYQQTILHDALECRTPATARMVELIARMHAAAQSCLEKGEPLAFPRRLLEDQQDGHHLPEPAYDHARLFPARLLLHGAGRQLTPAEAIALAQREGFTITLPAGRSGKQPKAGHDVEVERTFSRHTPACEWRGLASEIEAHCQARINEAVDPLRHQLYKARSKLREIERRALPARLSRLGNKLRRLLRLPQASPLSGTAQRPDRIAPPAPAP